MGIIITFLRKRGIRNHEAIATFLNELDKRYGSNVVSVIAMGSWSTKEAAEESDIDLVIVFVPDFFKSNLTAELRKMVEELSLTPKLEVWAHNEADIRNRRPKPGNYPPTIFSHHINGTGIILKGKNLLKYFKVSLIPKKEITELLEVAWKNLQSGLLGKAIIKAAYALILKKKWRQAY